MTRLADLITAVEGARITHGSPDTPVAAITDDSRGVTPGCAFIARRGHAEDGAQHTADAIAQGAKTIITGPDHPAAASAPAGLAWVTLPVADQSAVGLLAEQFHGHPGRRLKLVGVTGTNGKTTVAYITQHLLQAVGMKTGMIGTVVVDDTQHRVPAPMTTPGPIQLTEHMAAMVAHGADAAVLEVSSHALDQGRTDALSFAAAVFTNLTGDHLDYHQTMEAYAEAKGRLFRGLPPTATAIVNADDPYGAQVVSGCRAATRGCSLESTPATDRAAECRAEIHSLAVDHSRVDFHGPWGKIATRLPLVGRHNVANALHALAATHAVTGADAARLTAALETAPPVPGRLELVAAPADAVGKPRVLVDYAHTHDALRNVLAAIKPLVAGRLIVVFGCGGDRDRTKRPKMAAVAEALADLIVVTSDNPRTEDPKLVINDILAGLTAPGSDRVTVEPDRAVAIRHAVRTGCDGDTVLIAGKGHEDYQVIGTVKQPFDDRVHAAAALAGADHHAPT